MLKMNVTRFATTIFAVWLVLPGTLTGGDELSKDQQKTAIPDARTLLEQGRESGSLPKGLVIRMDACLQADGNAKGDSAPAELNEKWEFTTDQVRRIVYESVDDEDGTSLQARVESRPFDSKNLCQELLEGKAIELQARQGTGPKLAFVESGYDRGTRSIEVVWNEEIVLTLCETNGPGLVLYRETDARAFGTLYQKLANQAREAFASKAAEAK